MKHPVIIERQVINAGVRTIHEPKTDGACRDARDRVRRAVDKQRVAASSLHRRHHSLRHDQPAVLELSILNHQRQVVDAVFRGQTQCALRLVSNQ